MAAFPAQSTTRRRLRYTPLSCAKLPAVGGLLYSDGTSPQQDSTGPKHAFKSAALSEVYSALGHILVKVPHHPITAESIQTTDNAVEVKAGRIEARKPLALHRSMHSTWAPAAHLLGLPGHPSDVVLVVVCLLDQAGLHGCRLRTRCRSIRSHLPRFALSLHATQTAPVQ